MEGASTVVQQREEAAAAVRALQVRAPAVASARQELLASLHCRFLPWELRCSCVADINAHPRIHLQRSLAEAEEEVERQRRELSAGFMLQSQELEQKWRSQVRAPAAAPCVPLAPTCGRRPAIWMVPITSQQMLTGRGGAA